MQKATPGIKESSCLILNTDTVITGFYTHMYRDKKKSVLVWHQAEWTSPHLTWLSLLCSDTVYNQSSKTLFFFFSLKGIDYSQQLPLCWQFTVRLLLRVNLERALGWAEVTKAHCEIPMSVLWSACQDRICTCRAQRQSENKGNQDILPEHRAGDWYKKSEECCVQWDRGEISTEPEMCCKYLLWNGPSMGYLIMYILVLCLDRHRLVFDLDQDDFFQGTQFSGWILGTWGLSSAILLPRYWHSIILYQIRANTSTVKEI